jgi:hypothetical protein
MCISLIQPTISLEMPVPSRVHYGVHSFPVVNPKTLHSRLINWQDSLDNKIMLLRNSWSEGGTTKFQLIGDNIMRDITKPGSNSRSNFNLIRLDFDQYNSV